MPERLERVDECPACAGDVGIGVREKAWNNCPWCGFKLNKDEYKIEEALCNGAVPHEWRCRWCGVKRSE